MPFDQIRLARPLAVATLAAVSAVGLVACSGGGGDDAVANGDTHPQSAAVTIPTEVFEGDPAADARPLKEVKASAAVGDRVVFEARIGGRVDPFVDGRAMMIVADASIESCDELHGDTCPTPWDYCCEPRDSLMAGTATVQIVGADGRPLALGLEGRHGLEPLATVIVEGVVTTLEDGGAFVVDAERGSVRPRA